VRGKWSRPTSRKAPLTFTLIGLCILVSLFTSFGKDEKRWKDLRFSTSNASGLEAFADIGKGEVWRLITPVFGHGAPLHLLFNCYWLFILGSQIENAKGTLKLGLLVLVAAVIPNVLQAWFVGPNFLGISGVVCGLFGYVWMKSLYAPNEGMHISQITVIIFVAFLFICLTGMMGPIANVAHFGGLAVGLAAGYIPVLRKSRPGS
jgi:GlpG protein